MLPMLWKPEKTYSPWNFRGELDRLFEELFGEGEFAAPEAGHGKRFFPPMDVRETEEALIVETELPGMKEREFEVKVENGVLSLGAERQQEKDEKTRGYHRIERYYGRMERRLALPDYADAERVEATYTDGVLRVTIPKKPGAKPKAVSVKVRSEK
jgi:HSP20 family protein